MLVKYKEELTRPIQEAAQFFKTIEFQLGSLSHGLLSSGVVLNPNLFLVLVFHV
jgi:KNOX2 domain